MARNTYEISRIADGQNYQQTLETRAFKGVTSIDINLNFTNTSFEVVKLRIASDDQTIVWFDETQIPKTYTHTFCPTVGEYSSRRWIMITAIYNNFAAAEYFIPLYVAQPSFYTDFDGLKVIKAQFTDTGDNGDVFVILQNSTNNMHNMIIRANEIVLPSVSVVDVSLLAAVSAVSAVPPIVNPVSTDADDNIRVVEDVVQP